MFINNLKRWSRIDLPITNNFFIKLKTGNGNKNKLRLFGFGLYIV